MTSDATPSVDGRSIARRLDFEGPQPNYFGVTRAEAAPLSAGGFVGDVEAGGSCNASTLSLTPHCHGTHTEGIGHIADRRIDVVDIIPPRPLRALLVSLPERRAHEVPDTLAPATAPDDRVLALADLEAALADTDDAEALVIRTLPNPPAKAVAHYTGSDDYAYLTLDAVALVVDRGCRHLLIDTPSLDRLDDDGHLAVHRAFWGMPPGGRDPAAAARADATVTEMIYVPEEIPDGRYRLLIQPAPFSGDATPSNPLLFADTEQ